MKTVTTSVHIFEANDIVPDWVCRVEGAPQDNFRFNGRAAVVELEGMMQVMALERSDGALTTLNGVGGSITLIGAPTSWPGDLVYDGIVTMDNYVHIVN